MSSGYHNKHDSDSDPALDRRLARCPGAK
jgi:hypothetical protein